MSIAEPAVERASMTARRRGVGLTRARRHPRAATPFATIARACCRRATPNTRASRATRVSSSSRTHRLARRSRPPASSTRGTTAPIHSRTIPASASSECGLDIPSLCGQGVEEFGPPRQESPELPDESSDEALFTRPSQEPTLATHSRQIVPDSPGTPGLGPPPGDPPVPGKNSTRSSTRIDVEPTYAQ